MESYIFNTATEVFLGLVILLWALYWYLTKEYNFWEKNGVPCKKAVFPFGSFKDLVLGREHMGDAYAKIYKEFPGERYCGAVELNRPVLVIRDPELVKHILIKDFNHFVDRFPFYHNPKESISQHLFLMNEEDGWRDMRHKLSPAFSSGKMKHMFLLMLKCSKQLEDYFYKITENQASVDVKRVFANFTIDIIASCAFGVETNSLSGSNTEFYQIAVAIFKPTTWMIMKHRIMTVFPSLSKLINIERIAQKPKKMLHELVSSTVKYREENNVCRNDFLDILIGIKHNRNILDGTEEENGLKNNSRITKEEGLTMDQITAQAFIFFAAGFETASSTLTFCLYELAHHPEIQERLRLELETVLEKHGGEVSYQALQDLKYMDQVVDETLRMYASLAVIHRRCTKPYKIPGSDLVLQPGQKIRIPAYALHHDPQYYPDPDKFDPERFAPEKVKERHPCLHLPFGDGPRNCIGMRFGLMQTKIGLATFIPKFRVEIAPDTPIPIKLLPTSFVTQSDRPVTLKVIRR
ncbi:probable cytochrome P450 6a14 [Homalodisca vitripennis]|uniref:probable cytochrome P450 6a14 n=1 Tax=Homalodisca vitripennis TaxID=197043 RepID=UPI001EEC2A54|nr:probable cytochrome P450 6a14 [Homalodisca vitripennis]